MPNLCDKESYDCNDLIKIVGILRSPEGCPWDRAQDHHTIRNNFLEEAYEAVEAIDLESSALLREELGDVLLQIALHSQMEAEQGHFDFNDVPRAFSPECWSMMLHSKAFRASSLMSFMSAASIPIWR